MNCLGSHHAAIVTSGEFQFLVRIEFSDDEENYGAPGLVVRTYVTEDNLEIKMRIQPSGEPKAVIRTLQEMLNDDEHLQSLVAKIVETMPQMFS